MEWDNIDTESIGTIDAQSATATLVMPYIDGEQAGNAAEILCSRSGYKDSRLITVNDKDRIGFIKIVNSVFQNTNSKLFGYLASDVFPSRNWLVNSVKCFEKNKNGLLSFNDGKWAGALASFGLADRRWIDKLYKENTFFYSGYFSHYADTELSVLGHALGMLKYDPNIIMMEIDFEKDTKSVSLDDKLLWARRKSELKNCGVSWVNSRVFDLFS
jgi:hypothetical protein